MTAVVLPDWMGELQAPLPNETPGQHIARCIRAFIGVSLVQHEDLLQELFLVNETPTRAPQIAALKTNCATFMREIWCLAGCPDTFVVRAYNVGLGVSWDLQAARDLGMLYGAHDTVFCVVHATDAGNVLEPQLFKTQADAQKFIDDSGATDASVEQHQAWELVDVGWGLHYETPGQNNDHMEFALTKADLKTGVCDHAGGGRDANAVTMSSGDIRWSLGRPLQHVIAPFKMATAGPISTPGPASTPAAA